MKQIGCILILIAGLFFAGCEKKVPLNKKQFEALLIDLHKTDAALIVNRSVTGGDELKNYTFYNDVFQRYGITRADFDSCVYFYSAQTELFAKMYDNIIDSLNKQLTAVDIVLNELKSKDSVNYFPVSDTLMLDSLIIMDIDSITPGLYNFNTTIIFDSLEANKARYINAFFISGNGEDTLYVTQEIMVPIDTIRRKYSWSQYVDSVYSRLVIVFMDTIPERRPGWSERKARRRSSKYSVIKNIENFRGKAWNNQLFSPYISEKSRLRYAEELENKRRVNAGR